MHECDSNEYSFIDFLLLASSARNHLFIYFSYYFKWVGSIDMNANDQADANIIVDKDAGWIDQESTILNELQGILDSNQLDAVICVAGKLTLKFKCPNKTNQNFSFT